MVVWRIGRGEESRLAGDQLAKQRIGIEEPVDEGGCCAEAGVMDQAVQSEGQIDVTEFGRDGEEGESAARTQRQSLLRGKALNGGYGLLVIEQNTIGVFLEGERDGGGFAGMQCLADGENLGWRFDSEPCGRGVSPGTNMLGKMGNLKFPYHRGRGENFAKKLRKNIDRVDLDEIAQR